MEFLSNCAQNSTGSFGVREEDLEKVVEAMDDSLDTSEDPWEDEEDRLKVDPFSRGETLGLEVELWSREETFWGRFSVAMFFPWFVWLYEKIDTQMEVVMFFHINKCILLTM